MISYCDRSADVIQHHGKYQSREISWIKQYHGLEIDSFEKAMFPQDELVIFNAFFKPLESLV